MLHPQHDPSIEEASANLRADDIATTEIDEDDVEHYRFRLSRNLVRRLDQYLTDRVPHLSRAAVQRQIEEGLVTVNGRLAACGH
jgi:RNA-binding protein YlmH